MQVVYYIIISIFSLLLAYCMLKKRPMKDLICIAIMLVTFALRALHIK
ncbi:MAG: hypothetical protein PHO44_03935 [Sphaerochaetaceae bacterium]|jgi:hypothetical protein|nr:hypothetical protein [Sphaerochaetaceae bacterium]MDD3162902.1 hypothetical protein [Sphaerochaetaceae bacterium]MDD4007111.1 hypothetical protein [Sphaerochaetaceae bacterium]MDD4397336.1 hypothetical protein [Sphaerochaetaceae bacterium]